MRKPRILRALLCAATSLGLVLGVSSAHAGWGLYVGDKLVGMVPRSSLPGAPEIAANSLYVAGALYRSQRLLINPYIGHGRSSITATAGGQTYEAASSQTQIGVLLGLVFESGMYLGVNACQQSIKISSQQRTGSGDDGDNPWEAASGTQNPNNYQFSMTEWAFDAGLGYITKVSANFYFNFTLFLPHFGVRQAEGFIVSAYPSINVGTSWHF